MFGNDDFNKPTLVIRDRAGSGACGRRHLKQVHPRHQAPDWPPTDVRRACRSRRQSLVEAFSPFGVCALPNLQVRLRMDKSETSLGRLQRVLADRAVTGACVAYVREDVIAVAATGLRNEDTSELVTADAVFPVASLTKPIVSYAVLQLADAGILDLDEPLSHSIGPVTPDDPLSALMTLRHVLTHICGLQNIHEVLTFWFFLMRDALRSPSKRAFPAACRASRKARKADLREPPCQEKSPEPDRFVHAQRHGIGRFLPLHPR